MLGDVDLKSFVGALTQLSSRNTATKLAQATTNADLRQLFHDLGIPGKVEAGYKVRVLDLFIYGQQVFDGIPAAQRPNLELIEGDIRDTALLKKSLPGCDAVIHLACISNDPSFELDPSLGRSINYDAHQSSPCFRCS